MIGTPLAAIAEAVGGTLAGGADPNAVVTLVVADSHEATAGALFVCIAGERADGHDFADAAIESGAVACLAVRSLDVPCVVVDDTIAALGRLAHSYRMEVLTAEVVGITGSSGKTTTKDLLAQVLATAGPTVAPKGSFNTEVGLPLTVLSADAQTRFLVLEMGMRGIGHIAELMAIALPSISVFLNVGSAHIGVVGSQEGIAIAKGEILEGLPGDGTAIVNADDPLVMSQTARTNARVLTVGESDAAQVRATDVRLDAAARPAFTLAWSADGVVQQESVQLQYAGEHVVSNALAAAGAALALGLPFDQVVMGLRAARPQSRWRMEIHELADGITLVNDAYNANPESMRAALKTLSAMAAGRRTWAVLGEMLELGDASVPEHDAIGRLVVRLDVSKLVCVGPGAKVMHLGAATEGSWGDEAAWVPDVDAAIAMLRLALLPGDVVLVKASRSIGLERVAQALLDERGSAT